MIDNGKALGARQLAAALARISHGLSTAAADPGMSTALRSVGFLDVLSNTPAESSLRAPCIHARLRRPATKPREKSGLINTVTLPSFECEPGPLHTILQHQEQNLYYSDGTNHSVVSLNFSGEVRWMKIPADWPELLAGKGKCMGQGLTRVFSAAAWYSRFQALGIG